MGYNENDVESREAEDARIARAMQCDLDCTSLEELEAAADIYDRFVEDLWPPNYTGGRKSGRRY